MKPLGYNKADEKAGETRNFTFHISSAFLYVLGLTMGIAIMAVYTQLVIKTQVESLVREEEKRYHIIKEDLGDEDSFKESPPELVQNMTMESLKQSMGRQKRDTVGGGTLFTAAHLVGYAGPNLRSTMPRQGSFFKWIHGEGNSFSFMELEKKQTGTFIVINRKGYYLVYSQVTYSGYGFHEVGHETVRIEPNGQSSLMISVTTQQLQSAKSGSNTNSRAIDSGYHSGVFYLNSGDKIAVKPKYYFRNHVYVSENSAFYFGVCFLHDM